MCNHENYSIEETWEEEEMEKCASNCEICGAPGYIAANPNDLPSYLIGEDILSGDPGNSGRIVCEDCDSSNKQSNENFVKELNMDLLAEEMLINEYNLKIIIWEDGDITSIGAQEEVYHGVAAILRSYGTGNLDTSYFTNDFAQYDKEIDTYIEINTGRKIGDIEDVIRECIKDGDMTVFYDDWKEQILEQLKEDDHE